VQAHRAFCVWCRNWCRNAAVSSPAWCGTTRRSRVLVKERDIVVSSCPGYSRGRSVSEVDGASGADDVLHRNRVGSITRPSHGRRLSGHELPVADLHSCAMSSATQLNIGNRRARLRRDEVSSLRRSREISRSDARTSPKMRTMSLSRSYSVTRSRRPIASRVKTSRTGFSGRCSCSRAWTASSSRLAQLKRRRTGRMNE